MKKKLQSKDLRIGNLLQDQNGNLLEICELTNDNQVFKVVDRSKFPLPDGWQAKPILLTEKILTNSGLKQLSEKKASWYGEVNEMKMFLFGEEKDFYSSMFYIHKWGDTYYFSISTLDDGTESFERLAKIQYVHELQNLYFTLTGEEFELKDETKP